LEAAGAGAGSILLNTNDGGAAADGSVIFNGIVDVQSATAYEDGLALNVGDQNVDLTTASLSNLDHLVVVTATGAANSVTLGTVAVGDGAGLGSLPQNSINITTDTINLTDNLSTSGDTSNDGGGVLLTGAVVLGANVDVTTDAATSDGAVTFASTVDGAQTLQITAGTGNVVFTGLVGDTTPLGAMTIVSAANVTTNGVEAASFVQTDGTGTTTLNGATTTSAVAGVNIVKSDHCGKRSHNYLRRWYCHPER
jgi:hypothetical protein